MRYLSILILPLIILLSSCNNNTEPDLEIVFPIIEEYLPSTIEINSDDFDDEEKREIIKLANQQHVINDLSELPQDLMGFSPAYDNINFKQYTLLIKYELHDWTIDTYRNRYYRNTKEDTYNWYISIGTSSLESGTVDHIYFSRFAILVKKLPSNANYMAWIGLHVYNWFPD